MARSAFEKLSAGCARKFALHSVRWRGVHVLRRCVAVNDADAEMLGRERDRPNMPASRWLSRPLESATCLLKSTDRWITYDLAYADPSHFVRGFRGDKGPRG